MFTFSVGNYMNVTCGVITIYIRAETSAQQEHILTQSYKLFSKLLSTIKKFLVIQYLINSDKCMFW